MALGGTIHLAGVTFTVVGVMPRAFADETGVWVPAPSLPEDRRPPAYAGVAKLRPGQTLEAAGTELEQRVRAALATDPDRYGGMGVLAKPIGTQASRPDQPVIWLLIGVVGAVLLLGVSNLTQLFLVRAQGRAQGLAVRMALGGSRWRVGQRLATEALVVGLAASGLGLALTPWAIRAVAAYLDGQRPLPSVPGRDPATVGLALGVGLLAAVLVGLEPMRRAATVDVQGLLQRRTGGSLSTPRERRTRDALVALQIATALILATGTTIAASAYRTMSEADMGYDARDVVQAEPDYALLEIGPREQWEIAARVVERLERDPTVAGASAWQMYGQDYPPRPEGDVKVDGPPPAERDRWWPGWHLRVLPGTLEALGIGLVRGRTISDGDSRGTAPVALVSEQAARLLWPGESALGRQLRFGERGTWRTVVGVTEDVARLDQLGRYGAAAGQLTPQIFVPMAQAPEELPGWREFGCCLGVRIGARSGESAAAAQAALLRELAAVAPGLPIVEVGTLQELQMKSYMPNAITTTGVLIGVGTMVAAVLSIVGIVGVVVEGLGRRTREIGLRMALGASGPGLVRVVAREALLTATIGLTLGLIGIVVLDAGVDRYVSYSLLLRMGGDLLDPALLGVGSGAVLLLTAAASVVTAARATRLDPAVTLRSE